MLERLPAWLVLLGLLGTCRAPAHTAKAEQPSEQASAAVDAGSASESKAPPTVWQSGTTTFFDFDDDMVPDMTRTITPRTDGYLDVTEHDSQNGKRGFFDQRKELDVQGQRVTERRYRRPSPDAGWSLEYEHQASRVME